MPDVTLYEYVADIRVSVVIAADEANEAFAKIKDWGHEAWLSEGEIVGVNDVDLLDKRTVECADVDDVAHIDARKAAPCPEK